jgi:hypothetical protein
MEIDVTHMMEESDTMIELSGSRMEHGQDAGRITWNNSKAAGAERPLLTTDEMRDAARSHFREYGAWSEDEIAAWSEEDLQAIMAQDVAAAIRELEVLDSYPDIDLAEYERLCEQGTLSGRLSHGDDGRWYFYLGM